MDNVYGRHCAATHAYDGIAAKTVQIRGTEDLRHTGQYRRGADAHVSRLECEPHTSTQINATSRATRSRTWLRRCQATSR